MRPLLLVSQTVGLGKQRPTGCTGQALFRLASTALVQLHSWLWDSGCSIGFSDFAIAWVSQSQKEVMLGGWEGQRGGMETCQWASNHPYLLNNPAARESNWCSASSKTSADLCGTGCLAGWCEVTNIRPLEERKRESKHKIMPGNVLSQLVPQAPESSTPILLFALSSPPLRETLLRMDLGKPCHLQPWRPTGK